MARQNPENFNWGERYVDDNESESDFLEERAVFRSLAMRIQAEAEINKDQTDDSRENA